MRITTTTALTPLLLGLGLMLSACADVAEPGPGPLGTTRQPAAAPEEIQDEAPMRQEPGGPIQ